MREGEGSREERSVVRCWTCERGILKEARRCTCRHERQPLSCSKQPDTGAWWLSPSPVKVKLYLTRGALYDVAAAVKSEVASVAAKVLMVNIILRTANACIESEVYRERGGR